MSVQVDQFRELVVRPTLAVLNNYGVPYSMAAENLLVGTALHESAALKYIAQYPDGPARSVYQMEPATLADLELNYLRHKPKLREAFDGFRATAVSNDCQLCGNRLFATAAARLQYYRQPEPLPDDDDLEGLADYWKRYWNTEEGAGTVEQFIEAYELYQ